MRCSKGVLKRSEMNLGVEKATHMSRVVYMLRNNI